MIDKILKFATPFLLLVLVFQSFGGGTGVLGGNADNTTRLASVDLTEDLTIDDSVVIDTARGVRAASTTTDNLRVATGSTVLGIVATTTSWNPGALSAGASTSTEVSVSSTVTGFVRGLCQIGAFTSASSGANGLQFTTGCMYGTSTAILTLSVAPSSTGVLDIGASTVTIYQVKF